MTTNPNLHAVETQKFSENAANELLKRGQLVEFFKSIGLDLLPYGNAYKGLCPVCRNSAMFVGTDGKIHKIYWRCYSKDCLSNNKASNTVGAKLVKNILGLTRALMPDAKLPTAMKAIANFLGVRSTYDVTNGKFDPVPANEIMSEHLPF